MTDEQIHSEADKISPLFFLFLKIFRCFLQLNLLLGCIKLHPIYNAPLQCFKLARQKASTEMPRAAI